MTNQVALRDLTGGTTDIPAPDVVQTLAEWAQQLDAAMRIAKALCNTSFVPKHFQGKPEETAAAILTGSELGLGPMAALRIFFVINGRPEMYAEAKVAILTAHGHRVWTLPEERSDESVTVHGRRKGEKHIETITITMEQAKKAGWTTNATYAKTPQDMLYARAAGRVCRLIAPELLHGIATVGDPDEPPIQATASVGRVTAAEILGTATPAAADAPAAEKAKPEQAAEPLINQSQQRKLHASLGDLDLRDRDLALVHIAGIIGRELETTKDLTFVEARAVIDHLEAELRERRQAATEVNEGGDA
jgi:hypothetical protein